MRNSVHTYSIPMLIILACAPESPPTLARPPTLASQSNARCRGLHFGCSSVVRWVSFGGGAGGEGGGVGGGAACFLLSQSHGAISLLDY